MALAAAPEDSCIKLKCYAGNDRLQISFVGIYSAFPPPSYQPLKHHNNLQTQPSERKKQQAASWKTAANDPTTTSLANRRNTEAVCKALLFPLHCPAAAAHRQPPSNAPEQRPGETAKPPGPAESAKSRCREQPGLGPAPIPIPIPGPHSRRRPSACPTSSAWAQPRASGASSGRGPTGRDRIRYGPPSGPAQPPQPPLLGPPRAPSPPWPWRRAPSHGPRRDGGNGSPRRAVDGSG